MKRKTEEEIKIELKDKNPEVLLVGSYLGANKKTMFKCLKHNKCWETLPFLILKGCGCSECKAEKIGTAYRKTHEEFISELEDINPNIIICSEYINSQKKVKCKCKICGNDWETRASHLLEGHGCPQCGFNKIADERRKSQESFVSELNKLNPYIEIIGEYRTCHNKITCRCTMCDNLWEASPSHLLRGEGCPSCSKSIGERNIKKYLDEHNILYVQAQTFDDLLGVGERRLSYDFYLISYNTLIEFQGEQHNRPIDFFGGEEKYKIQQEHDERKRNYALLHNYNLLEIDYADRGNIDQILDNYLNNLKLETVETTGVA